MKLSFVGGCKFDATAAGQLVRVDESPKEIVEGNSEEVKPTIEITREPDHDPNPKPNNPDSGYDSPGEETIDRNCKDLETKYNVMKICFFCPEVG